MSDPFLAAKARALSQRAGSVPPATGALPADGAQPPAPGIGTLRERSLHAVLKYWADPEESRHEVALPCRLVADIYDGERVTEIQTRNFSKLRPKLARLLPSYRVTILYPIAQIKRLIWVDPESGELSPPRRSPKTGSAWDAFAELYYIRDYLKAAGEGEADLAVRLVYLEMEEYRLLNGWSRDRKKGSCRIERIPAALCGEQTLRCPADYAALLPPGLPEAFTVADLARELRLTKKRAGQVVNVLYTIGAIIREGKAKNAFLYRNPVFTKTE